MEPLSEHRKTDAGFDGSPLPPVSDSIKAWRARCGGTAIELEEIVKQRIGAGDFRVTVHHNPDSGWHATIYGRQPAEVHRWQVMADTIAVELCTHYELNE